MRHNNVLIVLGMHRSGTSLTAQWLSKCGLNLGDDLMEGGVSNKDGYFEDVEFYNVHEEIFRNHSIPYGGFENIENLSLSDFEISKIKLIVEKKNKEYYQWGWKEPRTCLFIDEYIKLIPDLKIIIVLRDFNAVINSLINRDIRLCRVKILNGGRMGWLKLKKFKLMKEKKTRKTLALKYSKATIVYYQKILNALNLKDNNNIVSLKFENMDEESERVIDKLEKWGFEVAPIKLSSIYKAQYITSNGVCDEISHVEREELQTLQKQLFSIAPL